MLKTTGVETSAMSIFVPQDSTAIQVGMLRQQLAASEQRVKELEAQLYTQVTALRQINNELEIATAKRCQEILTAMQVKGWNEKANPYSRTVEECKRAISTEFGLKEDV